MFGKKQHIFAGEGSKLARLPDKLQHLSIDIAVMM
jgi:hypothetical protein